MIENADIFFMPEDFDSVLTVGDLAEYIHFIINEIRSGNNRYIDLKQELEEIEELALELNNITSASELSIMFKIYKKIQNISIKFRKILSQYINLDTYDSIEYVFYYEGKRYVTETIKEEWLFKGGSSSELSIDLEKAVKDIDENCTSKTKDFILEYLQSHYEAYLNMISGTYKGILGKGKVSKGHVAEAFESHLAGHHFEDYESFNMVFSSMDEISINIQAIMALKLGKTEWYTHEGVTEGWIHIRGALGTQRGTVAGDVGRFQVKSFTSPKDKNAKKYTNIRLSSLTNLKRGLSLFNKVLSTDVDSSQLAYSIARYLSEPVSKAQKEVCAKAANKEMATPLFGLKNKKLEAIIHI